MYTTYYNQGTQNSSPLKFPTLEEEMVLISDLPVKIVKIKIYRNGFETKNLHLYEYTCRGNLYHWVHWVSKCILSFS